MKTYAIVCAMLAPLMPAAAANPFTSAPGVRAGVMRHAPAGEGELMSRGLSTAFDLLVPGGRGGWYPSRVLTQSYDPSTGEWSSGTPTTVSYDALHRVTGVRVAMPSVTGGEAYTVALGYDTDESVLPDTVTMSAYGSAARQLHVVYDSVVTDYPVKVEERTARGDGGWSSWAVTVDVAVERDSRGRVTAVTPRVLATDDLPLRYEKMVIDYGTSDYPVSVTSHEASDNGNGGVELDDGVSLTGLRFETCTNQIFFLTDLYTASNRLMECDFSDDDGCTRHMTFTYDDLGSYRASYTGTDDGEPVTGAMSMEYTDSYGSYVSTMRTAYTATGEYEEETETLVLDGYGLVLEHKSEQRDTDDTLVELDSWVKGSVGYSPSTGFPVMYTQSVRVDNSDIFSPVTRQLYDGYDPTAGAALAPADALRLSPKGIYTLDGRRLPAGAVPAPGFYIVDGVKTLVK